MMISRFYHKLYSELGPQGWWPGRTRFEVMVGAILTQNTNWSNVERAIRNLRRERALTPERMHALPVKDLAGLIRPAGYFNVKAKRLKHLTTHLHDRYGGNVGRFLKRPSRELRAELLEINGIGPETADSIVLYAAGRPEFVVDAYTKRILERHGLVDGSAGYDEVKKVFTEALEPDAEIFNEYHALLVLTGKDYCRPKNPRCGECPLGEFL